MKEAFGILLDFSLFIHRLPHVYVKFQQGKTLKMQGNSGDNKVLSLPSANRGLS